MTHGMLMLSLVLVLTLVGLAVAADPATEEKPDTAALVKGDNEFAFDLYTRLRTGEGNLFFSPFSISTALGMTSAGARGPTAEEMAKTLHFTLPPPRLHAARGALNKELAGDKAKGYQLAIANALWAQKGYEFLPEFLTLAKDHYESGVQQVDFQNDTETARNTINHWVEKQTQDKIKELLKPGFLRSDTRLVLTNAIYFKADWMHRFREDQTKPGPWKLSAEKKVDGVPLMQQTLKPAGYHETDDLQVAVLPYKGDALSMIVLLPRKEDGLSAVEQSLSAAKLEEWLKAVKPQSVDLTLPRFKMTVEADLTKTLMQMGMGLAFGKSADFSGLTRSEELMLSAVVHKAFVEVDEKGTEAAASTAVGVVPRSLPAAPVVFRADHPFVFLIRDNRTNSILFLGRLSNPAS
jgi:serpin B